VDEEEQNEELLVLKSRVTIDLCSCSICAGRTWHASGP
jgi:hypothetical protein